MALFCTLLFQPKRTINKHHFGEGKRIGWTLPAFLFLDGISQKFQKTIFQRRELSVMCVLVYIRRGEEGTRLVEKSLCHACVCFDRTTTTTSRTRTKNLLLSPLFLHEFYLFQPTLKKENFEWKDSKKASRLVRAWVTYFCFMLKIPILKCAQKCSSFKERQS